MSATFLKTLSLSAPEILSTLYNESLFTRNFPRPYETCYGHTCAQREFQTGYDKIQANIRPINFY